MSTISYNLDSPPDNFSTTLNGSIASDAVAIILNSVTGLPQEGVGVIFKKDSDGEVVASSIEFVHWTSITSQTLNLSDTNDRGITGSASGAQSHDSGDYFEVWVTGQYYYKKLRDGLLVEHNQNGTHKSTMTLPTNLVTQFKASGAEINTGTEDAKIVTPKAIADSYLGGAVANVQTQISSGWMAFPVALREWSLASTDGPTFVITTPSDITTVLSVGMRIKLNDTTFKYFIVTAVAATSVTLYGGTDYTITGGWSGSTVYYSSVKAPLGFPTDPAKWTASTTDTSSRSQASPTAAQWYNLGSLSLSIPIGAWNVDYQVYLQATRSPAGNIAIQCALSTANNSASDAELVTAVNVSSCVTGAMTASAQKHLTLASKTTYYLNARDGDSGLAAINFIGATRSTMIRAVCAYL